MISFGTHLFDENLGRWKKVLCLKIGNNEVLTNESMPT
jgi:hypothetical protein